MAMPIAKYLNGTMNKIYMVYWVVSCDIFVSIYSTVHAKFIMFCIISKSRRTMPRFSILNNISVCVCVWFYFFFCSCRSFSFKNNLIYFVLFKSYVIVKNTHFVRHSVQRAKSLFNDRVNEEKKGKNPLKRSKWCWWCEMIIYQSRIIDLLMHWMNLSMLTLVPRSYTH